MRRRTVIILIILIVVSLAILAILTIVSVRSRKEKLMITNVDDESDCIDVKMARLQTNLSKHNDELRGKSPKRSKYGYKKNENECRRVMEARYGVPFPTIRPDWLRSPHTTKRGKRRSLELDGYNPMNSSLRFDDVSSTGLAFEYDGIQHHEPGHFGMTIEQFDRLVERDRSKDKQCKNLGITLIRVPHTVKFNKIEEYLNGECDKYDQKEKSQSKRFCTIC